MIHATALEARVAAVNNANRYAMEIQPVLRTVFEPYIGRQIIKADGSLLAKIQKLLPEFPYTNSLHVYYASSKYALNWAVKAMETYQGSRPDDAFSTYYETGVYVGHMTGGVLTAMYDAPTLRIDFTPEEIISLREAYRTAKRLADDTLAALDPFGEYDR